SLAPKAFETLGVLVRHRGRLVGKEELLRSVWPDTIVEESNLSIIIHRLRKVLGDDRNECKYIETVSKLGYRLIAEVSETQEETELPVRAIEEEPPLTAQARNAAEKKIKSRLPSLPVLFLSVMVIGLAVAFFYVWSSKQRLEVEKAAAAPLVKSIAVLPFKTLSAEKGDEFLGLGVTDTLINSLSR